MATKTAAKPRKKGGFDSAALYRWARLLHAYFSAFAFIALILFSATGLLLDHPTWLNSKEPPERDMQLTLTSAEMAGKSEAALAQLVGKKVKLLGAYSSGETEDGMTQIRFDGVKGHSDIGIDRMTGQVDVTVHAQSPVEILNQLHRGKDAGKVWKLVIDLTAIIVLLMSAIGYVIFFSLRLRLATCISLTVLGLGALVGVYWWWVP